MGIKDALIRLGDYMGDPLITLRGNTELCAENCRCITACDENVAVLRTKAQDIRIVGTGLTLENYGAYGVKITGRIYSLTLEENGEDAVCST